MKGILPVIILILLAVAGYVSVKNFSNPDNGASAIFKNLKIPGPDSSEVSPNAARRGIATDFAPYSDPNFKYKISYPNDLEVHEYDDQQVAPGGESENSHTTAFEGPSPGEGFQVTVLPYTNNVITDARFKTDDPSGVMLEPQNIAIDGAPAKIFFGHNDQMGDTREIWFIHGGFLYEVTTYKALDSWLADIMQTWRFL